MTRVLVTGAGGQLGSYLLPALRDAGYDVRGMGHSEGPDIDMAVDITDRTQVARAMMAAKPDIVIHAAAMTNVDGCEEHPADADTVNHLGSANMAQIAAGQGAWLIGIGTDFVFPGDGGAPYAEDDPTAPISVYGCSKLAGERAILRADPSFAVARTAWLYGGAGKHFPRTVLNVLRQHGKMDVVDDEVGSPTFAGDLAHAIVALLPHRPAGIFHLINEGAASRYELARAVATAADIDPDLVSPISTRDFLARYPLPARRPANSTLRNIRAAALGVRLPPWEDAVNRYIPVLASETTPG
ncbi:MAG TPA: dTDP-4-dehydrorhamnose reductase [Thermomicrobiales bacterium]|nr:dTDP-4-dehydrorhamnose reductase [Thermomicrobiales bacterium]